MSRKRSNPLEILPAVVSSSEEDDDTSTGEGEESSSEEEDDVSSGNPAVKKPGTATSAKEKQQASDSESESEEETDSGTETEVKVPVKNPGSSAVKSVTKGLVAAKSQESKKVESCAKSATKKRSSETDGAASTDAKRVKRVSEKEEKKSGGGGEETKRNYFQRLWTEKDEIAVLQGFIDYKTDFGVSPFADINKFYESMKKSISFDVKKTQFTEKVRVLKKKFENNRGKGKNGEDPTFTKPHECKAFDLSKLVWGDKGLAPEPAVRKSGRSKKVEPVVKQELTNGDVSAELDAFVKPILVKSLARFGVDDLAAQQGWSRLASEDKKRFEEQWKQLQLRELEFYSQRSGFIHEVVTKMAEAFRPSP